MKRTIWIVASVIVLLLLLVGAAFVGGRLLSGQGQMEDPMAMFEGLPGGRGEVGSYSGVESGSAAIMVENVEELPETEPDVLGFFARREDNSVFVSPMDYGNGDGTTYMENEDGTIYMDPPSSGPEVEVVVTAETKVYKDVTEFSYGAYSTSESIQQKVEIGSADEIGKQSLVVVWGQRRGDRVVAQVLVYSEPTIFEMPMP